MFQKQADRVSGSNRAVMFSCCCQETGRRSVTQNFPDIDPHRVAEKSLKTNQAPVSGSRIKLPYFLHESHRRRVKIGINRFVTQQANHSTAGTRPVLQSLRRKSGDIRCCWGCQTGTLHPLSFSQRPAEESGLEERTHRKHACYFEKHHASIPYSHSSVS